MHADAHHRRVLAMLLVEAGLKVRAVEPTENAIEVAVAEPFDLILVGYEGMGEAAFSLAGEIRDRLGDEPPVVMLLPELQLPLVVQGIREGLSDVWPLNEDPQPVVRRVLALVLPERMDPLANVPSVEMSEVERTLQEMEPMLRALQADEEAVEMRERFKRALLELQGERDMMQAAQAAMDERARMLADERAALHLQRQTLAADRVRIDRAREELREERAIWEETLRDLQNREANLRDYEARLRERESGIEARLAGTRLPFARQPDLEREWDALEKSREVFEAEKAMFRDERMVLCDLDNQIRKREERLRELETKLAEKDRVRRGLPPPAAEAFDSAKRSASAAPFQPTARIRGIFGRKAPPPSSKAV